MFVGLSKAVDVPPYEKEDTRMKRQTQADWRVYRAMLQEIDFSCCRCLDPGAWCGSARITLRLSRNFS